MRGIRKEPDMRWHVPHQVPPLIQKMTNYEPVTEEIEGEEVVRAPPKEKAPHLSEAESWYPNCGTTIVQGKTVPDHRRDGWEWGRLTYQNGDMFLGYVDITQNCRGRGVVYRWKTGDAFAGRFVSSSWDYPKMVGEGVRFTPSRDEAERLEDGKSIGEYITPEEAVTLLDLEGVPPEWSQNYMQKRWEKENKETDDLGVRMTQVGKFNSDLYEEQPYSIMPEKGTVEVFRWLYEGLLADHDKPEPNGTHVTGMADKHDKVWA